MDSYADHYPFLGRTGEIQGKVAIFAGVNVCLGIIAFGASWIASRWITPRARALYDLCDPGDASFYYRIRGKMGKLNNRFLNEKKSITIELYDNEGTFVTKFKFPIRNRKEETKKNTKNSIKFSVARSKKLPPIGFFRLDHDDWEDRIFFSSVALEDLNGNGKIYLAKIDQLILMLGPAPEEVYKTEQVFPCTPEDGKRMEEGQYDLSIIEIAYFTLAFYTVALFMCLYLGRSPNNFLTSNDNAYAKFIPTGLAAGFFGATLDIAMSIFYKMIIKKYLGNNEFWFVYRAFVHLSIAITIIVFLFELVIVGSGRSPANSPDIDQYIENWTICAGTVAIVMFLTGLFIYMLESLYQIRYYEDFFNTINPASSFHGSNQSPKPPALKSTPSLSRSPKPTSRANENIGLTHYGSTNVSTLGEANSDVDGYKSKPKSI